MILDFRINNQRLERLDNNYLVNLSNNYIKCRFSFMSEDWENLNKYITFNSKTNNYRYPLNNQDNLLIVPNELLRGKYFHVKAYGYNQEEELLITTNDVIIVLDTVDDDPLTIIPTNEGFEEVINWLSEKINSKVTHFKVEGRKLLCYKDKQIIQIIPINNESIMNLLNEPFIDIDTSKLTDEGLLFYRRYEL